MSKIFYKLNIDTTPDNLEQINNLLGVKQNKNTGIWTYELIHADTPLAIQEDTVISHFLNIIEGKYDQLLRLGIKRENITLWIIYEYDNECNMEFHSEDTKRLGENGITLCVSCYQYSDN